MRKELSERYQHLNAKYNSPFGGGGRGDLQLDMIRDHPLEFMSETIV